MPLEVNYDLCIGCGICVSICPHDALYLKEMETASTNPGFLKDRELIVEIEKCSNCGHCLKECPAKAITI